MIYIVGDIVIQILVISPTLSYYYQSRSEQASITWSLICRLCLVEQVTLWEEALDYRHVTAAEVEVAGWKMTLLAGDGSDYDYSALSCTSDTSLNVPPIQEQEALKGVYYKRAQRLPPTDPSIPNALHPDDNGNLPTCGQRLHVIINVGGLRYQLPWTTLEDFPLSRLGQLRLCSSFDEIMGVCDDYDVIHNEFFFDRSPCAFRTILTFLRAGKLRSLREMCALSFKEELLYWGVPEESLEWCCRRRLLQRVEEYDELERVAEEDEDDEDDSGSGLARESRHSRWMGKLRDMVEKPHSGLPGKIFACLSVLFVTITAINLSISTMPAMREEEEYCKYQFVPRSSSVQKFGKYNFKEKKYNFKLGNEAFIWAKVTAKTFRIFFQLNAVLFILKYVWFPQKYELLLLYSF